ncbi:MAG: DUF721 domain-containing protein [Candidatus Omnitrophota bacterium]
MGKESPLKDVLKKIVADLEGKEREEATIVDAWQEAAGKKAVKHTKPVLLKANRLIVNVSDSSWLYKLTLEKSKLVKKINDRLENKRKIKELRFRIGNI